MMVLRPGFGPGSPAFLVEARKADILDRSRVFYLTIPPELGIMGITSSTKIFRRNYLPTLSVTNLNYMFSQANPK
ncbi:MAG: hypothetical protein QG670_872 [Thermoproteota archaeon]|nr:hypothetical protein [Thermoproteota archaeon]